MVASRDPPHIPTLDGLRGIAILLVMLHHFAQYGELRPDGAVDTVVSLVAGAGWTGVDLFFVLSGFLITGILYDAKGGKFYFRYFYIRRCLRIFPLYYAVLALFFLTLPLVCQPEQLHHALPTDQAWYWTYLINVKIAVDGWPGVPLLAHFWSLAVEEQYYLLWPVLVFLLPSRRLMAVCCAFILSAFCVRLGLGWARQPLAAYILTPARIDSLAIGAILALLARQPDGLWAWRRFAWVVAVGAGAALAVTMGWRDGLSAEDPLVYTIGYTLLACFFGALLTLAVTASAGSTMARVFSSRTLRFVGRYSYGLYVFHHPILILASRNFFTVADLPIVWGSQLPALGVYIALTGGLSLAAALSSWHFYESRFLNLKERFPYSRKGSAARSLKPEFR
jgi:peptidoglycan/LPS O-acetylase OafA/YrhL